MQTLLPSRYNFYVSGALYNDEHAIREQGRSWRDNLARVIANPAGRSGIDRTAFTQAEQFRTQPQGSAVSGPARVPGARCCLRPWSVSVS